jgi:hypothetical protein
MRRRIRRRRAALAALVLAAAAAGGFAFLVLRGPSLVLPSDPCGERPPLVTRQGVTLQPLAMRAFRKAERIAGQRLDVVQSYRSCKDQAKACLNICGNADGCPGRCAPPGLSWHQFGAAIDVTQAMLDTPGVIRALEEAGWCESVPASDPGHFSFGGCH